MVVGSGGYGAVKYRIVVMWICGRRVVAQGELDRVIIELHRRFWRVGDCYYCAIQRDRCVK